MDPAKQIEGFFIEFETAEMEDVRCELERRGYSEDGAGIKEALLDLLFDDEPEESSDVERVIGKARKFVTDNPATVKFGLDTIAGLAKMVTRKAARR